MASATSIDWGPLLHSATQNGSADARQVKKRAIKRASKLSSAYSKADLKASLKRFLKRPGSSYKVVGDVMVRVDQPQAGDAAVGDAVTGGNEAPPEGTERPAKKQKRSKHAHAAAVPQAHAPADEDGLQQKQDGTENAQAEAAPPAPAAVADGQGQQAAAANGTDASAKKQRKRKSRVEAAAKAIEKQQQQEQEQEQEQEEQQEPGQQQERKKRKTMGSKKRGEGASLGGGGAGGGSGGGWRDSFARTDVKSGHFSKAEKETLKAAVMEYAEANGKSTDDMSWLQATAKHSAKGAWVKIAEALPHRTIKAVWAAGTRMFHEGNYQGKWTKEEDKRLLELVEEKGTRWSEIGPVLGRMGITCRDRWREVRLGEKRNKGPWSADECTRLQEAVQELLAARAEAAGDSAAAEEAGADEAAAQWGDEDTKMDIASGRREQGKRRAQAVQLDGIDWSVISQKVGTRSNIQCLEKWYKQLRPSMVAAGEWGLNDDRRMLKSLFHEVEAGASYDFELDWGTLVAGRSAQVTRRRWHLMLRMIPDSRDLEFRDQVHALVDKYMPRLKQQAQQAQQAGGAAVEGG